MGGLVGEKGVTHAQSRKLEVCSTAPVKQNPQLLSQDRKNINRLTNRFPTEFNYRLP
jgi:hypothetical protein